MDGYDAYGANSPNDLSRVESYERESYPARERDPYRDSRRRSPGESPLSAMNAMNAPLPFRIRSVGMKLQNYTSRRAGIEPRLNNQIDAIMI